jgi:hypothetical protein
MPPSFQNYCDGNDAWLAWVFCMDYEQNHILVSNASSRFPSHLTKEGVFGPNNDGCTGCDCPINVKKMALEGYLHCRAWIKQEARY